MNPPHRLSHDQPSRRIAEPFARRDDAPMLRSVIVRPESFAFQNSDAPR
jgi:hypothetical protein